MNLLYVVAGHREPLVRAGRRNARGNKGEEGGGHGGDRLIYEAELARVFEGPTSCFCSSAVSLDSGDGLSSKKNSWGV